MTFALDVTQPRCVIDQAVIAFPLWRSGKRVGPIPKGSATAATSAVAAMGPPEQQVFIVESDGRPIWSSLQHGSNAGEHVSINHFWPNRVCRRIATAIRTGSGASTRFAVETGRASGKKCWDILISATALEPADAERFVITARDITSERRETAARDEVAAHDQLTGLVTRTQFLRDIDEFSSGPADTPLFGVLKIDIDGFRHLNDMLGQRGGDAILKTFAARLRGLVRRQDTVARIGSDAFGVILRDLVDESAGETSARRLIAGLARPTRFGELRIQGSVCAGLAVSCAKARSADDLCRNAGMALAAAQANGRGTLICFRPELSLAVRERESMLEIAEWAIARRRIFPRYQPKVDLQTGRIVGLEALLRWRSASGTIELPGQIWAALSDPILACQITDIMVEQVVADLVSWRRQGHVVTVAINVCDADLRREGFVDALLARLSAAQISTAQIEIEVTESVFVGRDPGRLQRSLKVLSDAGLRIALDDFGTGHASLLHLMEFPVDVIKIDRSFVAGMGSDPGHRAIVEGMLGLAAGLSIEVVAEGIERPEDAEFLRGAGCALGQGFLFGHALDARLIPSLFSGSGDLLPVPPAANLRAVA